MTETRAFLVRPTARRALRAAFLSGVAAIIYFSLDPTGGAAVPGSDKLHHALAYFAVSCCGLLAFHPRGAVAGGMIGLGVLLEIAQGVLTSARSAEVLDALADTIGVACALAAVRAADLALSRRRSNRQR